MRVCLAQEEERDVLVTVYDAQRPIVRDASFEHGWEPTLTPSELYPEPVWPISTPLPEKQLQPEPEPEPEPETEPQTGSESLQFRHSSPSTIKTLADFADALQDLDSVEDLVGLTAEEMEDLFAENTHLLKDGSKTPGKAQRRKLQQERAQQERAQQERVLQLQQTARSRSSLSSSRPTIKNLVGKTATFLSTFPANDQDKPRTQ
eukprot:COSAG06_NODE_544_length_14458_cov_18.391671_5_plen_205_part_00